MASGEVRDVSEEFIQVSVDFQAFSGAFRTISIDFRECLGFSGDFRHHDAFRNPLKPS